MRPGKQVLVWAVVAMMIANPASACRWRSWGCYQPVYCQPVYCSPVDCGTVYYESGCGSADVVMDESSCCSEGVTTHHSPAVVAPEPPTPQPSLDDAPPAPPEEPMPAPQATPKPAPAPTPTPKPAPAPKPVPPADTFAPPAADPAPAPKPAPQAAPPSEVEDLFSQPDMQPAPAAQPTPTQPAPSEPAAPSEVEDLFKDPAPAPSTPAPSDDVDDLFKDLDSDSGANKAAASETPAEAPAADKASDSEIEDLFSEPAEPMAAAELPEPTPALDEQPADSADGLRLWTDNTGKYQVRARLVVIGKTHVRLLKENGNFTTVPYTRLSQPDLAYVRSQGDASKIASF